MTTWVEVRRDALIANARAVTELVAPAGLCAVVKANGYGHGSVIAAEAFVAGGATMLGVGTIDEAEELRAGGIDHPILLLAAHLPEDAGRVIAADLTAAIGCSAAAEALNEAAGEAGRVAPVHLLIDTGMGRDGALPESAPALHRAVQGLAGLAIEGVFTHFPNSAARDPEPTRRQLGRFLELVGRLCPRPMLVHAANSAAALRLPEARLDLVRVGTLLYGQYPGPDLPRPLELQPTWALKSRLVEVRRLPAGARIGYGSETVLSRERLVGTLLVGWQHGLSLEPASLNAGWRGALRALRRRPPTVTVKGVPCPILGRISMQTVCLDVTDVPDAAVGDIAELPARRVTVDRGIPRLVL